MPENDLYPEHGRGGSKKPVTVLLVAAVAIAVALFLYETSDRTTSTGSSAPPTGAANPNILVPPGSGAASPTPP